MAVMPEESRTDDVEKLLAEEQAVEDRKKALISALLKQREAAIKDFDEKLAKLGYQPDNKHKRNHHKKTAAAPVPPAKPKA
jgi:hemerythrin